MKKLLRLLVISCSFINLALANTAGYYNDPTIFEEKIVFISENDLWLTDTKGTTAQRLTSYYSEIFSPIFSPDGKQIAFSGSHEGYGELYLLDLETLKTKRLTHLASNVRAITWIGHKIYFSSITPKKNEYTLSHINYYDLAHDQVVTLPYGPGSFIAIKDNVTALQRHNYPRDYAYLKGYKGGTKGDLWISLDGQHEFKELVKLEGNIFRPLIINDRVYFQSDHENHGNIYSVKFDGKDLKLEDKNDQGYYIRGISTDGKNIVYTAGGEIYFYDTLNKQSKKIEVKLNSNQAAREREFKNNKFLTEKWSAHPEKNYLAQIVRGKAVISHYFDGSFFEVGNPYFRYKHIAWLENGEAIALSSKHKKGDTVEIYDSEDLSLKHNFNYFDFGRITDISPSHKEKKFTVINNRGEIFIVDYSPKNKGIKKIDKSQFGYIAAANWSADDLYLTYTVATEDFFQKAVNKLYSVKEGNIFNLNDNIYNNSSAIISENNEYVFFLSNRDYIPYRDQYEWNFIYPFSLKPYLATLNYDLSNPFNKINDLKKTTPKEKKQIINVKRINERAVRFPIGIANYHAIYTHGQNIWFLATYPTPAIGQEQYNPEHKSSVYSLVHYDLAKQKLSPVIDGIDGAELTNNGQNFVVQIEGQYLRLINSQPGGNQPASYPIKAYDYNKESGWINLDFNLKVDRNLEWAQIFNEAFFYQKEKFNNPVKKIDWDYIYNKYRHLVNRISSRTELNDLLWEVYGELGTLHAYVMGGDYDNKAFYPIARLGCEFEYDSNYKAYRIKNLVQGDYNLTDRSNPLLNPGVNIRENDLVFAINYQQLSKDYTPERALLNVSHKRPILIETAFAKGKNKRIVKVEPLPSSRTMYYSQWVKKNQDYVTKHTDGKIGYIHIPDMTAFGYNEFFRSYMNQLKKDGLIIDIRFNTGGHASGYILDKIKRELIGHFEHKQFGKFSYPDNSSTGKMVLLNNQFTASDGDIMTHVFKTYKLGPVIGMRTWGGIIGIDFNGYLPDGGITSQPEYLMKFFNDDYKIENFGVEPDIEVDITPMDYKNNKDPQLDRAIQEIKAIVDSTTK
ncbi:S41 family peptidase [Rickettsiales endosymbiont of Stachyamoeba lipophora]|uniref:S41 family peptidase n=1 Tax=Rickettsiales endosymbiont of Stachyamoeba lipophora TaxID=2486578 RepID=UPI000F654B6B|nr:S41 family peptidase [Rickettsiales endosymbiont of Stachyamoeba lipophora]AZL15095.1 hypothetical protein EF513_00760 [Rickettsiales endosymbiont of Stachyamoeba lipophora]